MVDSHWISSALIDTLQSRSRPLADIGEEPFCCSHPSAVSRLRRQRTSLRNQHTLLGVENVFCVGCLGPPTGHKAIELADGGPKGAEHRLVRSNAAVYHCVRFEFAPPCADAARRPIVWTSGTFNWFATTATYLENGTMKPFPRPVWGALHLRSKPWLKRRHY